MNRAFIKRIICLIKGCVVRHVLVDGYVLGICDRCKRIYRIG